METIFQRLKQKKMYYQYVKLLMRIHESPHYQTGLKYLVLQHRRLDSPSTKRQRERTTSNLFGINPPTEPEKPAPARTHPGVMPIAQFRVSANLRAAPDEFLIMRPLSCKRSNFPSPSTLTNCTN